MQNRPGNQRPHYKTPQPSRRTKREVPSTGTRHVEMLHLSQSTELGAWAGVRSGRRRDGSKERETQKSLFGLPYGMSPTATSRHKLWLGVENIPHPLGCGEHPSST